MSETPQEIFIEMGETAVCEGLHENDFDEFRKRFVIALDRLLAEIERLREENQELKNNSGLPESIQWALNSGDGVYRP